MNNHFYTLGAFLIAGSLVFGATKYATHTTSENLPVNKTVMLATVGAQMFHQKSTAEERTIIDVRTPEEYNHSHIENAVLIDISDPTFEQKIQALDKHASYAVYCRSGNRSGQALSYMKAVGFTDVIDLDGGIIAWQEQGKELCVDC